MCDCPRKSAKLASDNGFPHWLFHFTILVTPSPNVLCQQPDPGAAVKVPLGIYSSNSLQLQYIRFPSHHDLPLDQLLLYYCCRDLAGHLQPYRGIFKRVCGGQSNCDSVWLLPVGSGTVTASGKTQTPWANVLSLFMAFPCVSHLSLPLSPLLVE